ncbi:right-handed parallel beta-helix repeat-containing protein [Caballeronia cordobensis]|uniref:right-handed parallel beta-helix repeat-containing protein n=1 Tax=Caballeronia cordobensis TaxID=1353886 RepID=UPI001589B775
MKDALAVNPAYDELTAGVDFTPGVSTSVTLGNLYGNPQNARVFFDAGYQGRDQILSLVGYVMTFTSAIPLGTQKIYVFGDSRREIGEPSDGTITDAKAAARSALFNRIFDPINPKDPAYGAVGNTVVNVSGAFVSGHDDTAAIQAAAAVAHARGGGRIELTGTFCVKSSIQLYDNVELVGKGGSIFYRKPAFDYQHCVILQGKNSAVRNLNISCDPSFVRGDTGFGICVNGAADSIVEGCTLNDIASAAIWVTNSTNTRVTGCRISSPKADGIHFSDGSNGFVASHNVLTGTQDDALAVVLDTVGGVQPQNGVLVGNLVNGTVNGHGVVFIGCVNLSIDANTLLNIGSASGIGNYQWNADTRKATNISITSNLISRTGLTTGGFGPINPLGVHGILLGFCADTTVMGNTISDINDNAGYTSAAIFLYAYTRVFIKGNTFKNCVSHGVWVYDATPSSPGDLTDLFIDDNLFFNVVKYAIKANPTTAFLNGLFVTHNKYKDCGYGVGISNVVSLGRTQATPLRYIGNIQLNRESQLPLLDATNASDIVKGNNIPTF